MIAPYTIAEFYPAALKKAITSHNAEIEKLREIEAGIAPRRAALVEAASIGRISGVKMIKQAEAIRRDEIAVAVDTLAFLYEREELAEQVRMVGTTEAARLRGLKGERREAVRQGLEATGVAKNLQSALIEGDRQTRELEAQAREAMQSELLSNIRKEDAAFLVATRAMIARTV